ncbi:MULTISPECIES: hypothetical protein [Sphingobacterium]|uniref:hypothetical protein n=1 Tax=Sphingobacterium TaxID=28453 RepID=UPI000957D68E|nr:MULTISPECIES: hypothetical protein [Sphingobacterium]APU95355.1 hypothetical protein BV902_02575 [Sphingobacterium sp. B29]MCS4166292.1 hypothetical protein [Sphingobacterium sp. BIGb0116]UQA75683.1 hypothetical protein K2F45_01330 [Sphingobacterium siyangense]
MMQHNPQFWISLSFAILGGAFCISGLLFRFYRFFKYKDIGQLLISVGVMALIWHVMIYCMIYTGEIQYYPRIYNKGIPFYYLVGPCFYFYVWLKFNPNSTLPKYWLLHLLPFCFGLIDVIPYAIAPLEEQKKLLRMLVEDIPLGFKHHYGFVDQQLHYMLRFGLAIAYIIGQWRLYYNADVDAKATKREVLIFNSVYSIYLLLQCSIVLAIILNSSQEAYILKSLDKLVWVSFCFLLFSLWFMLDGNKKSTLYYLK